jgi:hypothetical protein
MNFCPRVVPRSGTEGGKRFRNSALAEYQNREIFVSLIQENFEGARLKDVKKIFLFLLAEAKRRRAETLGGIVARRATIKNQHQDFLKKIRSNFRLSGQKLLVV